MITLTDEQTRILDEEHELHVNDKSKSYSREEVMQIIKGVRSFKRPRLNEINASVLAREQTFKFFYLRAGKRGRLQNLSFKRGLLNRRQKKSCF